MKCSKCGKEIIRNNFVIIDGQIICTDCTDTYNDNLSNKNEHYVAEDSIKKEEIIEHFDKKDNNSNYLSENKTDVNSIDIKLNNIDKRIIRWKEKLIDLSKRNRLLNFRLTKGSTLKIIDEMPPEIFKILYCDNHQMQFLPIKVNSENVSEEENLSKEELNENIEFKATEFQVYDENNLQGKHVDNYLQTNLSENELERTLRKISTTAKNTMDDLGFNVLFLTLGSVIWYENISSDVKYEAPLLLLPISITKKKNEFVIEYNDDDIILNPALALKLKNDFAINLDDINVSDIQSSEIKSIFETVQKRISKHKKWKLLNNIYIGLFSFAKFVMYKDLDKYSDKIKASSLVKSICKKSSGYQNFNIINEVCPVDKLDTNVLPQDTYQILDADSSQQQAIAFVKANNNLVIEGPPGTGKSQTIANIIAELLSQGKKVLFVSQKIAALSVVKNRLDSNGLEPYCLELHSNKINRKDVLANLTNSVRNNYDIQHEGSCLQALQEHRIELNDYVKELHTPVGNLNMKPFDAIGIICKWNQIPDFECMFENYSNWKKVDFDNKKEIFTRLKNIILKMGNPELFSWYGVNKKDIDSDYEFKLSIKSKMKELIESYENLSSNISNLSNIIDIEKVENIDDILKVQDIVKLISQIPDVLYRTLPLEDEYLSDKLNNVCQILKQYNNFNNKIKEKYNDNILSLDIDEYINLYEFYNQSLKNKLSLKFIKTNGEIKKYCINKYKPSSKQVLNDLKNVKNVLYWKSEIEKCDKIANQIFQKFWNKENSDVEHLNNLSSYILKLQGLLNDYLMNKNIIENLKTNKNNNIMLLETTSNIEKDKNNILTKSKELIEQLNIDMNLLFKSNNLQDISTSILMSKFSKMLKDIENLNIWNQYLHTINEIKSENLEYFKKLLFEKNIDINLFDIAFEVQFLRIWLKGYVYSKSKILREFDSYQHNRIINEFKSLDKDLINNAKLRLIQKLQNNSLNGLRNYQDETAELIHQGKLQRFRKSLRQIINSMPNLLMQIKPCLMMSPLTVSQLLDPELFKFDYIIFDEASQLTTEDCIGSMIRGEKLIVAGDSQQLPPTSFFRTVTEPTEEVYDDDFKEDLDSILDECSAAGFPKCQLKWHYRSKHEHLIAFSNKHLYKELYTFPSSVESSDSMGIKWNYHENDTSTEQNARLEEAKIVARAVVEHAKKYPNMSMGVATFNIKQKNLIEDEIANILKDDSSCAEYFNTNKAESFFVKNLESVQGDERDVIFISIGYFKNKNGILSMHFGPLNLDGGERRLNVLITRARYKIEIFSAIRYVDFDLDKTNSKGVALLKQYLEFAERGEVALIANTNAEIDDHFDSPFEEAVCHALREKGLIIKTQVGCSGYKIDMAIRDKNNPGKFLLGIECDGASYHSSATARDRDRLRQQVLEKLDWKFYRIWSTDWFRNPQRELDKLLEYIERLNTKNELTC